MKMTLIDKDKFIQDVISRKYSQASMRLIREQPEVKAIPIEWIKKYMDKVDIEDCGMVYLSPSGTFRDMLKEWEKENETN